MVLILILVLLIALGLILGPVLALVLLLVVAAVLFSFFDFGTFREGLSVWLPFQSRSQRMPVQ